MGEACLPLVPRQPEWARLGLTRATSRLNRSTTPGQLEGQYIAPPGSGQVRSSLPLNALTPGVPAPPGDTGVGTRPRALVIMLHVAPSPTEAQWATQRLPVSHGGAVRSVATSPGHWQSARASAWPACCVRRNALAKSGILRMRASSLSMRPAELARDC